MPIWICETCGNHYPDTRLPPNACVVCADERQWVPPSGQRWTNLQALRIAGHRSFLREKPAVGIGQRGLVVMAPEGNLLWDPPAFVDDSAFQAVVQVGGLQAVAASHPHLYGAMVEWSRAFDAEILLPEADERWLTRSAGAVRRWTGSVSVVPGITLVQCGGHFPGSAVVHWAAGDDGRGVLLCGDTILVTPGGDRVSFAWSIPNHLPLSEPAVRRIVNALRPHRFDRLYGVTWDRVLWRDAQRVLERSAERYVQLLRGEAGIGGPDMAANSG